MKLLNALLHPEFQCKRKQFTLNASQENYKSELYVVMRTFWNEVWYGSSLEYIFILCFYCWCMKYIQTSCLLVLNKDPIWARLIVTTEVTKKENEIG